MHQQYSQTVGEEIQFDQINEDWNIQDVGDDHDDNQSPSVFNLRPPSRLKIVNGSVNSSNSKPDLIKVSKCQRSSINQDNHKNSSSKSINKIPKKQCRICLEDQSQGRIVRPCKCTGSMQYAHQHCLCEWIKRKTNLKVRTKIHCQVCQQPFDYKISKRLSLSCQVLKQNYGKYKRTYLCFLLVMFALITIWASLATLTIIGFSGSTENVIRSKIFQAEQTRVIFICIVLVFLLILSFASILFLAEYGLKTQFVIKNVQNFSRKSKRISPKLYFNGA